MASRRIAILTLSIGAGHVRASTAISQALQEGPEPVNIRLLDVIHFGRPWFNGLYVRPYWWMLRRAPWLWRRLYQWRQTRRHRATAPHWVFRHGCVRVLEELRTFNPDLVIVTEIAAAEIGALAKREGWLSASLLAVQTDYQTEPPWVQPEIDFYCVGSKEARTQLISWGVSPHRILVCGIPIDPVFATPFDKAEVRKALGLEVARPTVLVMTGGMGPMPADQVVRSLERSELPLQVVVVAGHDESLRRKLERLRQELALDLRVHGWTDAIPELMAAADLLITKPGGMTTSEALAAGLPMVLTHPIPGPEEEHVRYLVERGAAVHAEGFAELVRHTHQILAHPARRMQMSQRGRELARPDAASAVAQVGRALLEKDSYIDLLASPPARPGESAYLM